MSVTRGATGLPGSRPAARSAALDASAPRELLVHNAEIIDVVTLTRYHGYFTVHQGRFVEVEAGDPPPEEHLRAVRRIDLQGGLVMPGMLDVHMHIESSLVTPRRFAEAALPWGTTTIMQDPHEIGNVLGAPGMRWMVRASQGLPLRILSAISSCIPATSPAIETPNASISPTEVLELAREAGVIALGEVMDFQGLIDGDPQLVSIVRAAADAGLSLEGHVPTLRGRELSRYLAFGIRSDHTLTTPAKLHEQLRKGAWVMLQEKSLDPEVVAAVMALPDRSRVLLITDDVMPNRLLHGHMSRIVETAIAHGWSALDALAAATLRPAAYLGLRDLGAIAPGYHADYLVLDALNRWPPREVVVAGSCVAERGVAHPITASTPHEPLLATTFAHQAVSASLLRIAGDGRKRVRARVIVITRVHSLTNLEECEVDLHDGVPIDESLALALVIPRAALQGSALPESFQVGLIRGLGLRDGGWASSFAHDSHNLLVLGRSPAAMATALRAVLQSGGAMAFAANADAPAELLPLPLAGLLSDAPIAEIAAAFERLEAGLRGVGVDVKNPILLLTLLSLTVSPHWKLSDKGIVDVAQRRVLAPLLN